MISTYLIAFGLKVLLLAIPLAVALLALRRMLLSQSANAWLYGATLVYGIVTAIGVLPWSIGMQSAPSLFLALASLSPMVWLSVTLLCDRDRVNRYDNKTLPDATLAPLVLENPELPPVPVFRHSKPEELIRSAVVSTSVQPAPKKPRHSIAETDPVPRGVLAVARAMRGHLDSDLPEGRSTVEKRKDRELGELTFLARPTT